MAPRVELIIVASGDARAELSGLLSSLHDQIRESGSPAVRVVSNRCTSLTNASLRSFHWIERCEFDTNFGYGGALNRAFFREQAAAEWIVACNSDLSFPPGSISRMLEVLGGAPPRTACIAPLLLDPPESLGRVQPSVGDFPTLATLLAGRARPRRTRKYRSTPRHACNVDWATGACLAIRADAFREVGGFDDAMFLDYEETDLCRRLADRGWRCRFEPSWRVVHLAPNAQRPADPARQIHTRRSLVRYFAKHRPAWELHALGLMLKSTLAVRGADHPFAPSWTAGLETYRQLQEQPV